MKNLILTSLAVSLMTVTSLANSAVIDLSDTSVTSESFANDLGSVNFAVEHIHSAGTGVLDSFLTIQATSEEQGYNTAGTPVPLQNHHGHTRDILLSDLEQTEGVYQFVLDANETTGGNLISLDGLKLFSTSIPSQNGSDLDGSGNWIGPESGTLLWDMDRDANGDYVDNYVLLDVLRDNTGSGVGDMFMSVDAGILDGAPAAEEYFILWSRFGLVAGAETDDGFEEWSIMTPVTAIPEPSTYALFAMGLLILGYKMRQKKQEQDSFVA